MKVKTKTSTRPYHLSDKQDTYLRYILKGINSLEIREEVKETLHWNDGEVNTVVMALRSVIENGYYEEDEKKWLNKLGDVYKKLRTLPFHHP